MMDSFAGRAYVLVNSYEEAENQIYWDDFLERSGYWVLVKMPLKGKFQIFYCHLVTATYFVGKLKLIYGKSTASFYLGATSSYYTQYLSFPRISFRSVLSTFFPNKVGDYGNVAICMYIL